MVRRLWGIAVVLAGLTTSGASAQADAALGRAEMGKVPLSAVLSELRTEHRLPALAAAVVRSNGEIESAVVGVRRVGTTEAALVGDLFHIGSVTKSMTATMLATLVEEGVLDWGSTLEELAPDWAGRMHEAYRQVTLRQLLSHTAGLTDPWSAGEWASVPYDPDTPGSRPRQQMALELLSRPPDTPPGEAWRYANVGYGIAAALAEHITGQEWEELMRRRLFEPLGLASAGFGWPVTTKRRDQPWGHVVEDSPGPDTIDGLTVWGPENPHRIPTVIAPAGDVHLSIRDFARYAMLHLRGLEGKPTAILSPGTFRELYRPVLEDYALGWNVVPNGTARLPGVKQLQHLGSGGTFTAVIALFPELDLAVVAVHNGGSNTPAVADILYTLVDWADTAPR
jgi:D-alanyl-D-alanine carboxypeptidase